MPIHRSFLERLINIIVKFETMPCSPGYLVYVEAAAAALLKLWWSIHTPDTKEEFHRFTGQSSLCHVKTTINGVRPAEDGSHMLARKALFSVAELADFAAWYAFVAGSTLDALNLFVSDIIKGTPQCNRPHGSGWGYGDIAVGGWPGHTDPEIWWPGPTWRTASWPEIPQCGPSILVPPGATAVIAGSAQVVTSFGSTPVPFAQRVVWKGQEHSPITVSEPEGSIENGFKTVSYTKAKNPFKDEHLLELQVSFPLSIPSVSAVTLPWGYGYKDWYYDHTDE